MSTAICRRAETAPGPTREKSISKICATQASRKPRLAFSSRSSLLATGFAGCAPLPCRVPFRSRPSPPSGAVRASRGRIIVLVIPVQRTILPSKICLDVRFRAKPTVPYRKGTMSDSDGSHSCWSTDQEHEHSQQPEHPGSRCSSRAADSLDSRRSYC